jgi:hypothetical protein
MKERADLIDWIRGELVGPGRRLKDSSIASFINHEFSDPLATRNGPLSWVPVADSEPQEVLYFERESPHRKYGIGLLHPDASASFRTGYDQAALDSSDTLGTDEEANANIESTENSQPTDIESDSDDLSVVSDHASAASVEPEDFEVTSADIRHPSTMGISFCVRLSSQGKIILRLPQSRHFPWQESGAAAFQLNGRYEQCKRRWIDEHGTSREAPVWRRVPATSTADSIVIDSARLAHGKVIREPVSAPSGCPLTLRIEMFPRLIPGRDGEWLVTAILRNSTSVKTLVESRESVLFQSYFEVAVSGGNFVKYPESRRSFSQLDPEEQSLALLYRESATWGIGHGCAAGWDTHPGEPPKLLYADVMPAVELPSMTPDIELDGKPIQLSMRGLSELPDNGTGAAWDSIDSLVAAYSGWIDRGQAEGLQLPQKLTPVAKRHFDGCRDCLTRMRSGVRLLRDDARVRKAFRLANLAMLLQQISAKQLGRRDLEWNESQRRVTPNGPHLAPWNIYEAGLEDINRVGSWRAFQIGFLLMSLDGVSDGAAPDRDMVDLIWFPTGGGKTEAYLGVMAFYMFHERLLMGDSSSGLKRDGTNVLMRYTLRMLTTQQFQRAASLVCAMEFIRRKHEIHDEGHIPGRRFSLGLWIGGDGSPNNIKDAKAKLSKFRSGDINGNPLVLTECPWCRSEIGRFTGERPSSKPKISDAEWKALRTRGIEVHPLQGPLLVCPDGSCEFGQEQHEYWLPVEVIDERIYEHPPSLVIATADKFAMISYRPKAGALFGRLFDHGQAIQSAFPPGLIVQDELHLISGPLGTMYALYEGVIEKLCSFQVGDKWIKPKIVASTATIRGASDQVMALYARPKTQLFPNPGLLMGDSFFGKYSRGSSGTLSHGRMYLGIHASDYGSVLTTQVRAFSSALFRPWSFADSRRDAWWTLLAFYNSIRELGGAKTLFDSDIRSRLKFMFNREGFAHDTRRNLRIVEELTSRLSQAEIVAMMDRLASQYDANNSADAIDACLASNIIEVGVDIDRLSLMGIVGQPKTTATYIQVSGRVGRKWWERPGLIMMIYNPSKSRDRSHYEQFHSYHRRLYERVEPTTATPFALSAIARGAPGVLLTLARQVSDASVQNPGAYAVGLETAYQLLRSRCQLVQIPEDRARSLAELERVRNELIWKWQQNPQAWEEFPPSVQGEYLMLWPGQFATKMQQIRGAVVPSSMRQVDRSAELTITPGYALTSPPPSAASGPVPGLPETVASPAAQTPSSKP